MTKRFQNQERKPHVHAVADQIGHAKHERTVPSDEVKEFRQQRVQEVVGRDLEIEYGEKVGWDVPQVRGGFIVGQWNEDSPRRRELDKEHACDGGQDPQRGHVDRPASGFLARQRRNDTAAPRSPDESVQPCGLYGTTLDFTGREVFRIFLELAVAVVQTAGR